MRTFKAGIAAHVAQGTPLFYMRINYNYLGCESVLFFSSFEKDGKYLTLFYSYVTSQCANSNTLWFTSFEEALAELQPELPVRRGGL